MFYLYIYYILYNILKFRTRSFKLTEINTSPIFSGIDERYPIKINYENIENIENIEKININIKKFDLLTKLKRININGLEEDFLFSKFKELDFYRIMYNDNLSIYLSPNLKEGNLFKDWDWDGFDSSI